jgi:Sulfotransferase family
VIQPSSTGPLVVGGVGGSGTRVVAEIARRLGVYIGADLNTSADNLWATLLLRRPAWYLEHLHDGGGEIDTALTILEEAMNGRLEVNPGTEDFLERAASDLGHQGLGRNWTDGRLASLVERGTSGESHTAWGWKEPNSHIYVEHLYRHFNGHLRYLHVIRNGLDMAYSTNQWQVHTWGWLFGIDPDATVTVSTALDYWIRANKGAVELASALLGDGFLLVNFDDLCADPAGGVRRIVEFLAIDTSPLLLAQLTGMPKRPASSGRWRRTGLSPFTRQQVSEVTALGFSIAG